MLNFNKKRLIRLWQFIIVLACFSTIVMLFVYSTQINKMNHQILHNQTDSLSRVLLRQTASIAGDAIETNNGPHLQALVAQLSNEPLILDASIYDLEGSVLASSHDAMSLDQLTGLNTLFLSPVSGENNLWNLSLKMSNYLALFASRWSMAT